MSVTEQHIKLGELLVQRGVISDSDRNDALSRQVIHGGRIGSNLVELGAVSIEAVADALGIQLGVPAADLRGYKIPPHTLETIPPAVCQKYMILPIRLDDTTLHLAMQDPKRRDLIEYLVSALQIRIQPYVVPQLRLLYLLERYHGLQRPKRFLREKETTVTDERRTYLEPTVDPASVTTSPSSAEIPKPPATQTSQYEDDATGTGSHRVIPTTEEPERVATAAEEPRQFDRQPLDAVLDELAQATSREAIVTSLVQPVVPHTTLSLLLLPRGELAVALAASGTSLTPKQVHAFVVPLKGPSTIKRAYLEHAGVCCATTEDPLQQMIATYLRTPVPRWACVVPVIVGGQAVHLLCTHLASETASGAVDMLLKLAEAGANAYGRLIGCSSS